MARNTCPHCGLVMNSTEFDGRLRHPKSGAPLRVNMDQCPQCDGMWFDRHELETTMGLGRSVEALARVPTLPCCDACGAEVLPHAPRCSACDADVTLPCPACDKRLRKLLVMGVQLDQCEGCRGVWCDGGELHTLHADVRKRYLLGGEARHARCLGCDCVLDFGADGSAGIRQLCASCTVVRTDRPLRGSVGVAMPVSGGTSDLVDAAAGVAELAFDLFSLINFD